MTAVLWLLIVVLLISNLILWWLLLEVIGAHEVAIDSTQALNGVLTEHGRRLSAVETRANHAEAFIAASPPSCHAPNPNPKRTG